MSGAAANQRTVVATLRLAPPEGMDRWTAALVARHSRLSGGQANEAIRSLRNAGKIKFGALELSPSMVVEPSAPVAGEGGDPLAPAFGEAISIASNAAASLSAFKELPPVPGADDTFAMAPADPTPPQPSAAAPLPPSPTRGEGKRAPRDPYLSALVANAKRAPGAPVVVPPIGSRATIEQETATEPRAHPGCEHGDVAAAGEILSPPAEFPGHTDPAVRDTADEAGAPVVRAGVPASSLPAPPGNPLGVELLGEIEAYLVRTRMSATMLGDLAVGHAGYVGVLRKRRTARPQTALPLREFMERWPQGVTRDEFTAWGHARAAENAEAYRAASHAAAPGEAGSLADDVKAEALAAGERRHVARKFGGGVGNPLSANVVAVQAVLLAEPEDAFLFLRRKWPALLRQVIALGKIEETTPATMLARVIDAGILSIADNLREEAA